MPTVKVRFNKNAAQTIKYVFKDRQEQDPVSAKLCSDREDQAIEEFEAVRRAHNFKRGNEVVHLVQSFNHEDSAQHDLEKLNQAGHDLAAEYFKGHQFVVVTHTDKAHIHNHIVVNTVGVETGKRIHNKKEHWHNLRDINDDIAKRFGLHVPDREARGRAARMPDKVERMVRFGRNSYVADMLQKSDFARAYATNYDEFGAILSKFGISARIEDKNITYFYAGVSRGKRGKNMGRLYDKPGLEEQFRKNDIQFFHDPKTRRVMRDYIERLRKEPGATRPLGEELAAKSKGQFEFGRKDYSQYKTVPRRDGGPSFNAERALKNSIIPMDQINRAARGNIIRYCDRNGIFVNDRKDGTWELIGRPGVVLKEYEWWNRRNKTRGSLIDFVAAHKKVSYLSAIAEITGNPRLLLLEQQFGEVKRKFTPLYIPKQERMESGKAARELGFFLRHVGCDERLAKPLLDQERVQVAKSGVIRWFAEGDNNGAIEWFRDREDQWQKRKRGEFSKPFLSRNGHGREGVVYVDPISFLKSQGREVLFGKGPHRPQLVLVEPDHRLVDRFINDNQALTSIRVVTRNKITPSQAEVELFNTLNHRYRENPIHIGFTELDGVSPSKAKGISLEI